MKNDRTFADCFTGTHRGRGGMTRRNFLSSPLVATPVSVALPTLAGALMPLSAFAADDSQLVLTPRFYPLGEFQPEIDLEGRIAVVTGASRGIGRATAEALVDAGVVVIGTSRNAAAVPNPPDFRLIDLDLTKPKSIRKFGRKLRRVLNGRSVEILINNAGRFAIGPMNTREINDSGFYAEQQKTVWETLYEGHVNITHELLPLMPDTGYARVLYTVSSAANLAGGSDPLSPWIQPYISAKRALLAYANCLRFTLQQRSSNITVSTVNPYIIATTGAEHPNPVYLQPVQDTGFESGPSDSPFNQVLSLIRQLQSSGLPASFVGETYAQLLASSNPPENVVVASEVYPDDLRGGNEFIHSLVMSENLVSSMPFECS